MKEKLGNIATYINGYPFQPSDWADEGKPIIRIQDLTGTTYQTNRYSGNIDKKYFVKKGDILISWSASLGVYVWEGEDALLNQHIFKVVFNKIEVDKMYFVYQLSSLLKRFAHEAHGATMKHLTKPVFDSIPFSLPSLDEQRQIATIFNKIESLICNRNQQLEKLDLLVKAKFYEMFGDPVCNDKKWHSSSMNNIAPIKECKDNVQSTNGKFWLLNLDMVEAQTGEVLEEVMVDSGEIGASTVTFSTDNILYSKLRPYLNKVVVPKKSGYATSELLPLKPNQSVLNRIYLAALLRSASFVHYIQNQVAGAKMPRVSMDVFKKFEVICPPIELQNEFAHFVERTENIKSKIKQSLEKLELLKQSLLQKYFG